MLATLILKACIGYNEPSVNTTIVFIKGRVTDSIYSHHHPRDIPDCIPRFPSCSPGCAIQLKRLLYSIYNNKANYFLDLHYRY